MNLAEKVTQSFALLYRRVSLSSRPEAIEREIAFVRSEAKILQRGRLTATAKARPQAAFTMIEIAISLAIIAFALVAIIGILPFAMGVQKENRQETIINQDATVLLNAIRSGDRGADDLTNYVYAITNYARFWNPRPNGVLAPGPIETYGYTRTLSTLNGSLTPVQLPLTNGYRIIGLLTSPKFITNPNGTVLSNHVIAFVRSISGPASEKIPQTNDLVQQLALSYRVSAEVSPYTTNTFFDANWTNVLDPRIAGNTNEIFARSNYLRMVRTFETNLHDLRLTFRWPLAPNGAPGPNRQVYRTMVGGVVTNDPPGFPYFFIKPRTYLKGT